ncbi:hypothetical protein RJ641_028619 [Dillenia turbinata]|uniref:Uncharacterized protein n=1 Tax=Dillenia turbinata TaxID=194707 RepID=A0AAN8WCA5_9MAGN
MVHSISLCIRINSCSVAKHYLSRHFSLQFSSLASKMGNDEGVSELCLLNNRIILIILDDIDDAGPATRLTTFGGSSKKMFVGSIANDLETPSVPYSIPKHDYNQMPLGGIAIDLVNPSVPFRMPKHYYLSGNPDKSSNSKELTRVTHFSKRGICSLRPPQSPKLSSPTNDEDLVLPSSCRRDNRRQNLAVTVHL